MFSPFATFDDCFAARLIAPLFRSHARLHRQQWRSHHHCRDRSRFARDLMVQEVGFAKLQALGIKLVAADSPQSFLDDTPTSKLIRQILGAVSEFDKRWSLPS